MEVAMSEQPKTTGPVEYEILVDGRLDQRWSTWFGAMTLSPLPGDGPVEITRLCGPVADQAQLRGILNTIWDLNLGVLSLTVIDNRERQIAASDRGGQTP
jgi:hypothetical protein